MNKIFKVVWSKIKNCYVVVSEVAKNVITGSIKSAKIGSTPMTKGLALGAMMAFVITGNVWAETTTEYNDYFLPAGDFDNVKVAANSSVSIDGKYIIATDNSYKLYSNSKVFSEDKPNKLETTGTISMSTTDKYNRLNIYAGYATSKSTVKEADNNLFVIKHNLISNENCELYGAILAYEGESIDELTISDNGIIIDSATLKSINDNHYLIVTGALAQGKDNNEDETRAEGNYVKIENAILDTNKAMIAGALSRGGASLENNQVEIKNTDIKNGWIAGAEGENNDEVKVNGNSVTIDGNSKISCDVYGGLNSTGTASDNSINIKGNADVSEARLHGDYEGAGTGNALNLETGWNGVVGSADNFNIINVGDGVEATFKESIVADEQNTVINIGEESLLIGQIITKETGSSSLSFTNGSAWKVTGKSNVSNLQGDTVTINVDKVEEDLVTITNGVADDQKVILNVTDDDLGVDVTAGVQTMVDTVVDGNGKSVFEKITDEEIDLKATVDATIAEDGSVQNVTTSIKPGDKFVVESDVAVSGGLNAADDKFTVDSETGDVIANDVFANGGNGVLVGLRETAEKTEVNRVAIEAEVDRATKADEALNNRITAEETERAKADEELNNRITAEETERAKADEELNNRITAEETERAKADEELNNRITAEETERAKADEELNNRITAEETERAKADLTLAGNDIASGAINHESGTITLTRNNGTEFELEGVLCDSRLDAVSYDAKTGKMIFTIKDHYNQDKDNSIVVEDIASKAALDKEISDRILADDIERQERIDGDNMLNSKLNQLGSKVNKVGAGAAALAALHPLDFDPDDKLSFSAGVGNYGGETATALGAFYRPNEKVMISAAGTMGNGENMVNMGVSFALDKTNNVSNSRTAMAREIVDLRAHVARQEQALARQDQQIAQLVAMVNQLTGNTMSYEVNKDIIFPDVSENHWAYEYIHSLAAKGIIEGYPDGNFDGDRTMTRYEFATMLYKAMQKGTVLNEQIRQEFSAELGRIRVDRIKGAGSDTNKIERVRVNADVDRDDYSSK